MTPAEEIKAIGKGGMSGAPITARSLEVVRYIHQKSEGKLPIIAVGGIMSVEDALNMLDAGATLIQTIHRLHLRRTRTGQTDQPGHPEKKNHRNSS